MLNEEKIRIITKMVSYEQNIGKKNFAIGNYFKSDYIVWQMTKSFISVTIAYVVCLGVYFLYDFEVLIQDIYQMDLVQFARDILWKYIVCASIYMLLSYLLHITRYQKVRNSLKSYYRSLNELIKIYKKERMERIR